MTTFTSLDELTPRERETLRLLALGYGNREIGEQLFISTRTAETHRAHLQEKLGLKTRADLVQYALAWGVLDDDRPKTCPGCGRPVD